MTMGEVVNKKRAILKNYIELSKPRIVSLLIFTALVTALVTPDNTFTIEKALKLVLACLLAASGASILNNYIDRDIDKQMNRTKNRPLIKGEIKPRQALIVGLILVTCAILVASQLNNNTTIYITAGIIVYVLVYTLWLKRRSTSNIVIGGASGSFIVLAGYAAAEGTTPYLAVLMALLIFLWTPLHFWSLAIAYKNEYQKVNLPYLPVKYGITKTARLILLYTILVITVSLIPYSIGSLGIIYLIAVLVFGLKIAVSNYELLYDPTRKRALQSYKLSGIYLLGIFSAILIDRMLV